MISSMSSRRTAAPALSTKTTAKVAAGATGTRRVATTVKTAKKKNAPFKMTARTRSYSNRRVVIIPLCSTQMKSECLMRLPVEVPWRNPVYIPIVSGIQCLRRTAALFAGRPKKPHQKSLRRRRTPSQRLTTAES